jgi:hypothetical protein
MPRRTDSVAKFTDFGDDGILLETLIGRYVLNADARKIWRLVDGRRMLSEIADEIATTTRLPIDDVASSVLDICERMCHLGVTELADGFGLTS